MEVIYASTGQPDKRCRKLTTEYSGVSPYGVLGFPFSIHLINGIIYNLIL